MAIGNGGGKILVVKEGIMSTHVVSAVVRKRKANCGCIMSASRNPAGPKYDWGNKFKYNSGQLASEAIIKRGFIFDTTQAVTGAYAKPIFVEKLGASLVCFRL